MKARFFGGVKVAVVGAFGAVLSLAQTGHATPYTENVPAPTSIPLPPEYPAAGGVVIVLTGVNGNVYYQFSDPDGAFVGYQNRGRPRAFRGNPFTINNPVQLDCGFRSCSDYFGGEIARMDVRFSAYDGDTQSGGFDEDDISLIINGTNIGSWSGIQTEATNDTGTQSFGFNTGFGNGTFDTAWFASTDQNLLNNILTTGRTTTQVFDDDPNDNYWDFTRGPSLAEEDIRTIAPGYELEKTVNGGATSYLSVGEMITYDYVVRNIGSVRIDNITLDDDKIGTVSCSPTSLDPTMSGGTAEEATCEATYEVTQEDIDRGELTNIAIANGDPEYGELGAVEAQVTMTGPALSSSIDVQKTPNVGQFSTVGQVITYDFVVTNTGNSTLSDIAVSDPLIPSLSCSVASLAPAPAQNTLTCSGSYTVTQSDIDGFAINGVQLANTASVSGTDPNGASVSDSDTALLNGPQAAPVLDLEKQALAASFAAVGDVIPYQFTITNLGNVTWPNGVTLDDPLTSDESCPAGAIAPGGSVTCTASYTVDQDDLDAGERANSATASVTVGGQTVSDTATALVSATLNEGLEIVKALSTGPNPFSAPLQELVYTYTLTNTGNTRLSTFAVSDDKVAVTCPAVTIDPGATVVCTSDPYVIMQADLDAGAVLNMASATAQTPLGATVASDPTSLSVPADQNPALTMAKASDPDPVLPEQFFSGAMIDYVYTITNSGNVTITDAVTVTDDQIDGVISCPAGPIAPGNSVECRATYEVTSQDVLNATVVNVATATDGTVTSNTDSVGIPQSGSPGIMLSKVADTASFDDTSDVLSYTFTVTNSGTTVISDAQPITISDPLIGDFVCGPQPLNLAAGESYSCTATYGPVTQADIDAGEVVNTASASFPFASTTVTSPDSTATVPANVTPALTLSKTAVAADGGAQFDTLGEEIVFTLAVSNDSTQTLASVEVTDPLVPGFSCTITNLAPMATDTSCELRYAVTQADLDAGEINNQATALGTSPTGATASDSDTAQILINPAAATQVLAVEKTADLGAFAQVGDVITFAIEVRNDGNLTLSNVAISDPALGLSCTIGTLAPLDSDDSCTGSHVVTQADIDAGSYFNEATATADGGLSETSAVTVPGPTRTEGMTFTKLADGPYGAVGDVVTFTLAVRNDGNTTLSNVVVFDDFFTPDLTCSIASIAPGVTDASCVGSYTIMQGDIDAGQITNTAQVNGDGIDGAPLPQQTATEVVGGPTESASLLVTKAEADGNGLFGAVGSSELYSFGVTNTGNVTMTSVTVSDPQAGYSCVIPSIAPGVTVTTCPAGGTLEGSIAVTQAMVDAGSLSNTVTASGTSPLGTAAQDTATITLGGPDQLPVLSLAKTSTGLATFAAIGDVLSYDYVVTNAGNITLTAPITVQDDKTTVSCPAMPTGGLAPSQSLTCTATYAVTQVDLDANAVTNTANADIAQPVVPSTTYPDGVAVVSSPTDSATVVADQMPAIEIAKSIAPNTDATYSSLSDVVTFQFTVTNSGNVTLTNPITVTDANIPAVLTCPAAGPVSVAPSQSVVCTTTWSPEQGDLDAGSFVNSATASVDFGGVTVATPTPATATAIAVQTPDMEVVKTLTGIREPGPAPTAPAPFAPGKVAEYAYVITNGGNTTVLGPVMVSDNLIPTVVCPAGDILPGGMMTCTGSYTLSNDDVAVGSVTNVATATDANGVSSPPASESIPGDVDPALNVEKTADVATFDAVGDQITYTYEVTNTSPGTTTGGGVLVRPSFVNAITIFDDKIVDGAGNPIPITCAPTDGVLDPDESTTCSAVYTITQADLDAVQSDGGSGLVSGFVTNNATAETTFGTAEVVSPPAAVTVFGDPNPSLMVDKTVSAGDNPADVGDVLTYQITTTNDGNQTMNGVTVTDPMLGALGCQIGGVAAAPPFTLAPSDAVVCEGSYTVTQADVDSQTLMNTAAVTGASPDGTTVNETGVYVHPLVGDMAAVSLVKTLSDGEPQSAYSAVGEEVEFTMTVTNSGNVTLTTIDVTDSLVPGTCTIGPLAPGETDTTCTFIYTINQTDLDNGEIANTGFASAQPAVPGSDVVEASDEVVGQGPEFEPQFSMNKTADIAAFDAPNTLITYTYVVANTGNVTITDQPMLSDDKIPAADLSCEAIPVDGLLPQGSIECTGTYLTTQGDVDAGGVTNLATVTAPNPYDPANPITRTDTLTVPSDRTADLIVAKRADVVADVLAGDVITYSYDVTNTGNVTLAPVTLGDDHVSAAGVTALAIQNGGVIASLAPNQSATLTATYTVTQEDVDQGVTLANTVTATPTPPAGVPSEPVSDMLEVTVADPAPLLEVIKTVPTVPAVIEPGTVVTFEIAVENTGNVSLDTVRLVDTLRRADATPITPAPTPVLVSGDGGVAGILDVDEVWIYEVDYALTQADIDAGGISNSVLAEGIDPFGTPIQDVSDNGTPTGTGSTPTFFAITAAPSVEGVKTITSSTLGVDEVVTFEITIENTGNVTLTSVDVASDILVRADGTPLTLGGGPSFVRADMGSASGTLMVGETATYRATYVLTQADVDAGGIENSATVTGTPPSGPAVSDVSDDDGAGDDPTVLVIPSTPALALVKSLASGGPVYDAVDDELVFEFEVTNEGNVTITDAITINDRMITDAGEAITCAPTPLAPGDSLICQGSYFVTQADLDAGAITNAATAQDGTSVSPSDSVTVPALQTPALSMTKVADEIASVDFIVGAVANYTYTVTNTGNVTITEPVAITDNRIDPADIVCPAFPPTGLAPNDTYVCTASYTVTTDDVALGTVTNNATASDGSVTSPSVSETIPADGIPALTLEKTLSAVNGDTDLTAFAAVGDVLTYAFTVTNSGEVSFANDVVVNDPLIAEAPVVCFTSTPARPDLIPTSSVMCEGTYVVTQDDLDAGEVYNEATASTEFGTGPTIVESPAGSQTTPASEGPAISIVKTVADLPVTAVDQVLTYTLTVTNEGNQTLNSVVAEDALLPGLVCEAAVLAPAAELICSDTYVVTQADVDAGVLVNDASVSAVSPTGAGVTDATTLSTDMPASDPSFTLVKSATPDPFGGVGSGISYTFTVANTGNVTLFDVTISDAISTPAYSCVIPRLSVGSTDASCTLAYVVTQDDVDAGEITNVATATATDPFGDMTMAEDEITTAGPDAAPAIEATKTASLNGTIPGSVVDFRLVVENTGTVTLTAPEIDDTMVRANGSPTILTTPFVLQSGDSDGDGFLDVTETWIYGATYVLGQADLNAGGFENSVTVSADDPFGTTVSDVSDDGDNGDGNITDDPTVVEIIPGPAINTVKTLVSAGSMAGEDVVFEITATNVGNVTLTTPEVIDTLTRADGGAVEGAVVGPVLTSGNGGGIDPGEAWVWSYTYTLEQADLDAGGLVNVATASGEAPDGAVVSDLADNGNDGDGNTTDDATRLTILPEPTLSVIKTLVSTGLSAGELVVFDVVATNTGNVTLSNLVIEETMQNDDGTALTPSLIEVVDGSAESLPVTQSMTFRVSYALTQADIDSGGITNSALVTGSTPVGAFVSDVSDNGEGDGSAPTLAPIAQTDGMEVTKEAGVPTRIAPDLYELVFTMTVTNTGNVTQTGLIIEDDLAPFVAPAVLGGVETPVLSGFAAGTGNGAYDGLSDINLVSSGTEVLPGETGTIVLTVRYDTALGFPAGVNTVSAQSDRIDVPVTAATGVTVGADPDILATKTVNPSTAVVGDTVTYTITFQNRLATAEANLTLVDALPVGLTYVPDSATYNGSATPAPTQIGRMLQWGGVTLAPSETVTLTVDARVTGGSGELINEAYVLDPTGAVVSNVATAVLSLRVEPVFQCADIIGKVFDDRNMNGYQDGPDGTAYAPISNQDFVGGKFDSPPSYEREGGEPGLANVRLSTVTGTIITTDDYGRFSVPCAELPAAIGSNFTLKLDTRSLPTGYRVTTENPRVVRVTPGTMARLNFGATIATVVDIDLMGSAFVGNTDQPSAALVRGVDQLVAALSEQPSVLRLTYYRSGEGQDLARARMDVLESLIREKWRGRGSYRLPIERTINRLQ